MYLQHGFSRITAWLLMVMLAMVACGLSLVAPFSTLKISPLIIGVVLGMVLGNGFKNAAYAMAEHHVTAISAKQILRLGIILYGFKITLADIAFVGLGGVALAFLMVFSTFFIGLMVGKRLGLSRESSILISSGSAICGAAAVLATQSSIQAKAENVAVAVCTVVVFGTVGMFLYPVLYQFGMLGLESKQMGFLMGASLHEVAHAVAAGAGVGGDAEQTTVIIKMLRVLMLVPFLVMLGIFFTEKTRERSIKASVPYFALWFLAAVLVGSLMPQSLRIVGLPYIIGLDTFLLTVAMIALGLSIRKDVLANAGKRPFILALVLMIWLFIAAYGLTVILT